MQFNILLEELLNELSGEEIYSKYYKTIPKKVFMNVVSFDPQTKINSGVVVKLGRYSKVLLNLFITKRLKKEDLPRAKEYLEYVYKYRIPIDDKKINGLSDIYDLIKKYVVKSNTTVSNLFNSIPKNEYNILFNGNNWIIVQPLTEVASCYIGYGTEWCTTWGKNSLDKRFKERNSYYPGYTKQGPLYIIINKSDNNEKYQFHFESKQYMDKNDGRINIENFLNENEEVKMFFFPTLFGKISDNINLEINRIDVLSEEDSVNLIKKSLGNNIENTLINAILSGDKSILSNLINDDNFVDVDLILPKIDFYVKQLSRDCDDVSEVISIFDSEVSNSSNNLYDDAHDYINNGNNIWEDILGDYYRENEYSVKNRLGIYNKNVFIKTFLTDISDDEKIVDAYIDSYVDLNYNNREQAFNNELNNITKYINFDSFHRSHEIIKLSAAYFVLYLKSKNINKIDDINDVIDGYISEYDMPTYYDYYPEYDMSFPTYETNKLKDAIDDFFEILLDSNFNPEDCVKARGELSKIIGKYFDDGKTFENEIVKVDLINSQIDCDDMSIVIRYLNKQTNKKYEGKIKYNNLTNYLFNYKLFESLIKFKKNI